MNYDYTINLISRHEDFLQGKLIYHLSKGEQEQIKIVNEHITELRAAIKSLTASSLLMEEGKR